MKTVEVNDIKFELTELNSYGFGIGVRRWRDEYDKRHFIIKTVHGLFDKKMYEFQHTPIVISDVFNTEKFSRRSNLRVLDMPIKFPGSSEYRLPKELNQFDEAIAKIVSFEHTINPHIDQYYAYLTIDQGDIAVNTFQRRPGMHVDGFQGARVKNKRPINRSYIIYDNTPTVFYPQSFRTDYLNEETDNFFEAFDEQADEESAITFDPYSIILMNAYTVHRANKVYTPVYRTFLRVSFDTLMFDRFGNTHNPMFHYGWSMVSRNTQKDLKFKPLPNHNKDAF